MTICDWIFFFVGAWHFYTGLEEHAVHKKVLARMRFLDSLSWKYDMTWSDDGKVSLGIMAPTQGEHQCLEQINTILPRVAGVVFFGLSMSCQSFFYT